MEREMCEAGLWEGRKLNKPGNHKMAARGPESPLEIGAHGFQVTPVNIVVGFSPAKLSSVVHG